MCHTRFQDPGPCGPLTTQLRKLLVLPTAHGAQNRAQNPLLRHALLSHESRPHQPRCTSFTLHLKLVWRRRRNGLKSSLDRLVATGSWGMAGLHYSMRAPCPMRHHPRCLLAPPGPRPFLPTQQHLKPKAPPDSASLAVICHHVALYRTAQHRADGGGVPSGSLHHLHKGFRFTGGAGAPGRGNGQGT